MCIHSRDDLTLILGGKHTFKIECSRAVLTQCWRRRVVIVFCLRQDSFPRSCQFLRGESEVCRLRTKAPNRLEQLTVNCCNHVNRRSDFGNCNQW